MLSSCKQTSKVVTENEQVAVLPLPSVAVQVTVVVPTGKIEPEAGVQTSVTPGQLSDAVVVKFTTPLAVVAGQVIAVTAVTLAGHVMTGGWVSLTVTVNVQVGPAAVHVTVVVPTGKNEPDAGEHTTAPQVPVVVGGG